MSIEYPTLKTGDVIQCRDRFEAAVLGSNLHNEGFRYKTTSNNKIIITKDNANEKQFEGNS